MPQKKNTLNGINKVLSTIEENVSELVIIAKILDSIKIHFILFTSKVL